MNRNILFWAFAALLLISESIWAQSDKKDQKFCDNLGKIIASAESSGFGSLKKEGKGTDIYSSNTYLVTSKAKIYYNDNAKSNIYEEVIAVISDTAKTAEQQTAVLEYNVNRIMSCLQKADWTILREQDAEGGFFDIKNLKSRVFMKVYKQDKNIVLEISRPEISMARCISGDCINGFGRMQYENGDLYEGHFLRSQRIGIGKYIWANDGTRFEGSWLLDSINGYGTYYNAKGEPEKESYFMLGNIITLDTSKKDFCQYGDCKNGFGMYYYKGGQLYMGQFRNGLQNGIGLFESKDGVYYGEFFEGKYDGTGVVFTTKGDVFRGAFSNGNQVGEVKQQSKEGESVIEGKIEDSVIVGAEYTPEGILLRIGKWEGDKFIPSETKGDKNLVAFAESLAKLYSYRDTKYGRLRGNMRKGKRVVYYDALFKLKDANATFVREEVDKEPYVRANLNLPGGTKEQAIEKFDWAVRNLRKSLNSNWKSDPGKVKDTPDQAIRNYFFINMQNTESFIEVKIENNQVFVDIH